MTWMAPAHTTRKADGSFSLALRNETKTIETEYGLQVIRLDCVPLTTDDGSGATQWPTISGMTRVATPAGVDSATKFYVDIRGARILFYATVTGSKTVSYFPGEWVLRYDQFADEGASDGGNQIPLLVGGYLPRSMNRGAALRDSEPFYILDESGLSPLMMAADNGDGTNTVEFGGGAHPAPVYARDGLTVGTGLRFYTDRAHFYDSLGKITGNKDLTLDIDNDASGTDAKLRVTKDDSAVELASVDEAGKLSMLGGAGAVEAYGFENIGSMKFTIDSDSNSIDAAFQWGHYTTSFQQLMKLTEAGQVKIGTGDPSYALDVTGQIHASTYLSATLGVKSNLIEPLNGVDMGYAAPATKGHLFSIDGTQRMKLDANGLLEIGSGSVDGSLEMTRSSTNDPFITLQKNGAGATTARIFAGESLPASPQSGDVCILIGGVSPGLYWYDTAWRQCAEL